jgi:hypothetical protein
MPDGLGNTVFICSLLLHWDLLVSLSDPRVQYFNVGDRSIRPQREPAFRAVPLASSKAKDFSRKYLTTLAGRNAAFRPNLRTFSKDMLSARTFLAPIERALGTFRVERTIREIRIRTRIGARNRIYSRQSGFRF